ncbi:MAG: hypothetical protein ACREDX_03725 [Aestuariivirga sp.]
MISAATPEDARQLELLTSPVGLPRSGHTRYAAAMYFYVHGMIGAGTLEVYRVCAPLDREDPIKILQAHGLAGDVPAVTAKDVV